MGITSLGVCHPTRHALSAKRKPSGPYAIEIVHVNARITRFYNWHDPAAAKISPSNLDVSS